MAPSALLLLLSVVVAVTASCAAGEQDVKAEEAGCGEASAEASDSGVSGTSGGAGIDAGRGGPGDAMLDVALTEDASVGDAACATATVRAEPVALPVDIIWIVDNSVSMKPAIVELTQGLNAFADLISQKGIDYRVIMLSLRSAQPEVTVLGSPRYAVCVPPPLAGNDECGNGPRFFQSSIDIRSLQTLEQTLGTLGQTAGYRQGDERGGEPWRGWLRPGATRSFVIVSDDNSRFSAAHFEHFAGGPNPFNSNDLPPGLLEPFWDGWFERYAFNGIYGWGSESDSFVRCQYPDGSLPRSSGATYTELVERNGGVRAKICEGAAAWGSFFDDVARTMFGQAIRCDLALPQSTDLDPRRVNVLVRADSGTTTLSKVSSATQCGDIGGWYYDDELTPSLVVLCPASCEALRNEAQRGVGSIEVVFGCASVVR